MSKEYKLPHSSDLQKSFDLKPKQQEIEARISQIRAHFFEVYAFYSTEVNPTPFAKNAKEVLVQAFELFEKAKCDMYAIEFINEVSNESRS